MDALALAAFFGRPTAENLAGDAQYEQEAYTDYPDPEDARKVRQASEAASLPFKVTLLDAAVERTIAHARAHAGVTTDELDVALQQHLHTVVASLCMTQSSYEMDDRVRVMMARVLERVIPLPLLRDKVARLMQIELLEVIHHKNGWHNVKWMEPLLYVARTVEPRSMRDAIPPLLDLLLMVEFRSDAEVQASATGASNTRLLKLACEHDASLGHWNATAVLWTDANTTASKVDAATFYNYRGAAMSERMCYLLTRATGHDLALDERVNTVSGAISLAQLVDRQDKDEASAAHGVVLELLLAERRSVVNEEQRARLQSNDLAGKSLLAQVMIACLAMSTYNLPDLAVTYSRRARICRALFQHPRLQAVLPTTHHLFSETLLFAMFAYEYVRSRAESSTHDLFYVDFHFGNDKEGDEVVPSNVTSPLFANVPLPAIFYMFARSSPLSPVHNWLRASCVKNMMPLGVRINVTPRHQRAIWVGRPRCVMLFTSPLLDAHVHQLIDTFWISNSFLTPLVAQREISRLIRAHPAWTVETARAQVDTLPRHTLERAPRNQVAVYASMNLADAGVRAAMADRIVLEMQLRVCAVPSVREQYVTIACEMETFTSEIRKAARLVGDTLTAQSVTVWCESDVFRYLASRARAL